MRRSACLLGFALLCAACSDGSAPPPAITAPSVAALDRAKGPEVRKVNMMDECDPKTFGAQGITCLRHGGLRFDEFIAQLTKHGEVGGWHFAPKDLDARVGETLLAINKGGEVHTFTEVEHFGGGIVPVLNTLSGNPQPAPECLKLEADDFVQPGATYSDEVKEEGVEYYQCCIHPWMRAVVRVRHG